MLSSGSSSKGFTNDLGWNLALEYLGCLEEAAGEGLRMAEALQDKKEEVDTYKEKVKKIEGREKDVRENLEKEREARRVSEVKCGDVSRGENGRKSRQHSDNDVAAQPLTLRSPQPGRLLRRRSTELCLAYTISSRTLPTPLRTTGLRGWRRGEETGRGRGEN